MKIIHSFWTTPLRRYASLALETPKSHLPVTPSGWCSVRSMLEVMYWGCHQAVSLYGRENVILITDSFGQELFQKKLKFPYAEVHLDLDALADFELVDLWTYGKILAYRRMESPFFHIDTDWIFRKALPKQYESSPIVIQQFEQGVDNLQPAPGLRISPRPCGYVQALDMLDKLPHLPNDLVEAKDLKIFPHLGIFGGQDLGLIGQYCDIVEELVTHEDNKQVLLDMVETGQDIGFFNILLERIALAAVLNTEDALPVLPTVDYQISTTSLSQTALDDIGIIHLMDTKQVIPHQVRRYLDNYGSRNPKFYGQIMAIDSWLPELLEEHGQ